jgi:hypothetical protein
MSAIADVLENDRSADHRAAVASGRNALREIREAANMVFWEMQSPYLLCYSWTKIVEKLDKDCGESWELGQRGKNKRRSLFGAFRCRRRRT